VGTAGAVGGGVRFVYVAGDASGGATKARPSTCIPRRERRADGDTPELAVLPLPLRETEGGRKEPTSIIATRRLSAPSCEGTLGRLVWWLCDTGNSAVSSSGSVSLNDSAE
jgi:hypothetical protein